MVSGTLFLTVAIFFRSVDFSESSVTDPDFQESFNSIETLLATSPAERCQLINKVLEQQRAAEMLMQAAQLTIRAFQIIEAQDEPAPTTEASLELKDAGEVEGTCPKLEYPYFNEQCVNVSGIPNACRDIRECDFVDTILALGGWPTVCGWIHENAADPPRKWPKVCCGMPLSIGEPLKQEFVQSMIKNPRSSTTAVDIREDKNRMGVTVAMATEPPPVQCVLPLVPEPDTPEGGARFGNSPHSRQEFSKDSEFLNGLMHDSIFSMEFRSSGSDGVLFYVATRNNRPDYLALVMKAGKLIFLFDAGQGSAVISSEKTYNDDQWHRVVFLRQAQKGELVVDDLEEVKGRSPGGATRVDDLRSPLFIGGLSENVVAGAKSKLQDVTASFPGCIRNVDAQGELLTEDEMQSVGTAACSSNVERGTFFAAAGGHLVLHEKFRVGQQLSISLDIKPRNLSGVLVAIHGKADLLVLQLVDGRVHFTADSGSGPASLTHATPHLCDGQFHTVRAELSSDSMTLTVDDVRSEERGGAVGGTVDTFDPLHVGGLPESGWSRGGVLAKVPFVGCIRNLELNGAPPPLEKSRIEGAVTLSSCPTT